MLAIFGKSLARASRVVACFTAPPFLLSSFFYFFLFLLLPSEERLFLTFFLFALFLFERGEEQARRVTDCKIVLLSSRFFSPPTPVIPPIHGRKRVFGSQLKRGGRVARLKKSISFLLESPPVCLGLQYILPSLRSTWKRKRHLDAPKNTYFSKAPCHVMGFLSLIWYVWGDNSAMECEQKSTL